MSKPSWRECLSVFADIIQVTTFFGLTLAGLVAGLVVLIGWLNEAPWFWVAVGTPVAALSTLLILNSRRGLAKHADDTSLLGSDEFIPMPEATTRAYEQLRAYKSLWAKVADRFAGSSLGRTKEEGTLLYFATAFATENVPLHGEHPPSRIREPIDPQEFKRGGFRDSGSTFYYHGEKHPQYTNIAVRKEDLTRAIEKMKKDFGRAI